MNPDEIGSIKKSQQQSRILRKGLPKFYDLNIEELGLRQSIEHKTPVVSYYLRRPEMFPMRLYISEKANGENFQVSFDARFGKFVICSKNVSLLAEHRQESRSIEDKVSTVGARDGQPRPGPSRFDLVRLMSEHFFDICDGLSPSELLELKKELSTHTMVGEFCGHAQLQHLVRYSRPQIRAFALVEKGSEALCVHPERSRDFAGRFGFTSVGMVELVARSPEQLEKVLKKVHQSVFLNESEQESEGSIVYFYSGGQQRVTHIVKLKTLDYRVKRKIREKLRTLVKRGNAKKNLLSEVVGRFENELRDLMILQKNKKQIKGASKREKLLDYYRQMGEFMLSVGERLARAGFQILERFVEFLIISKPLFELKYRNMLVLDLLRYESIFGECFNDASCLRKLETLYTNSRIQESILINLRNQLVDRAMREVTIDLPKKIIVFVPLGIVGSGKSFIRDNIVMAISQKYGVWGGSVSSDQVSKEVIERVKQEPQRHKVSIHSSDELIFFKSARARKQQFQNALKELFRAVELSFERESARSEETQTAAQSEDSNPDANSATSRSQIDQNKSPLLSANWREKQIGGKRRVVYIDKNHPLQNGLSGVLSGYSRMVNSSECVMVGLIPKKQEQFSTNKLFYFDDKTLFLCLSNVLKRSDHETLDQSPEKILNVFLFFLNFFRKELKPRQSIKYLIEYPMHFEVFREAVCDDEESEATSNEAVTKEEFSGFASNLEKLFKFKQQTDLSDKETDPLQRMHLSNDFAFKLKQRPEFEAIMRMVDASAVDYGSGGNAFSRFFEQKISQVLEKSNQDLVKWQTQAGAECSFLGLNCANSTDRLFELTKRCFEYHQSSLETKPNCAQFGSILGSLRFGRSGPDLSLYNSISKRTLKMMPNWHVTLQYFSESDHDSRAASRKFRENVQIEVEISHCVYIPDTLLTLLVRPSEQLRSRFKMIRVKPSNPILHITVMADGCLPKESNNVLGQICERARDSGRCVLDSEGFRLFSKIRLENKKMKNVILMEFQNRVNVPCWSQRYYK